MSDEPKKPCLCNEGGICDNCYEFQFDRATKLEQENAELKKKVEEERKKIEEAYKKYGSVFGVEE